MPSISSGSSVIGFAEQDSMGTPVTSDGNFTYIPISEGSIGPSAVAFPLDDETGFGPLSRGIAKTAVNVIGQLTFVPRTTSLLKLMKAALGYVGSSTTGGINYDAFGMDWIQSNQSFSPAVTFPASTELFYIRCDAGSSDVITISGKDGANTKTFTITGNGSGSTGSTKFTEISSISLSSGTNFGSLKIGVLEGTSGSTTATTQEISFKKTDYYDIPYYTFRFYPGNKWREVYQDIRVAGLSFEFTPPQFMRATLSLMGRVPSTGTSTLNSVTVDNSSLYVSNAGFAIINGELLRVLSGNVVIQNNIKIDEEYVLGSIYPESLSIVSRMITFNFIAKIQSGSSLYRLMMYDPSGGNSWTLAPFETNDFMMMLGSITTGASSAFTTKPPSYSPLRNYMLFLTDSNVAKLQAMVAPLAIRPQGSLVMQIALNVIQKSVNSNYSPIVVKYINYG